jgi:predicted dehydrogenase
LKVGIIGTGGISNAHYRGYTKSGLGEIVALADVSQKNLKARAEEWGVPEDRCFTDYRKLLKLDDVQAVSICTPNKYHAKQSIDALKAGKHVLCEKPMAMTVAEAKRMVNAARENDRQLQIGLMHRYRPEAEFVRKLVDENVLGDIYYARCQAIRRRGVPSWGVFGQMDEQGGGGLIDIGVHQIDLTWWMMGCPAPVSVTGATYRTIGDQPGHFGSFGPWDHKTSTVEDFASAYVRFENGATMSIECSFNVNLPHGRQGQDIVGTRGGAGLSPLTVQIEQFGHLTDCTPQDICMLDFKGKKVGWSHHEKEVADFCNNILQGRPVSIPANEAIVTQKIINGIYKSAKSGKPVNIR